jgi:sugar lactone lactonase YvrE
MSKARDLADLISAGNPLADGAVSVAEISDLTASAAELNKLDGVTASTAELNQVVGATSALQTQLDNISVTSGSLTKTFVQNETADITLSQGITSAPVVSATKEVPQTGVSTKGNWDVNSTASNYDFHNTAANVTLTPSTLLDVTAATYDSNSRSTGGSYGPRLSSDGLKLFVNDQGANNIRQYNLSTAWLLPSSATHTTFSTASQVTDESGFCFSDNGLHFYLADSNYSSGQNLLHQYSITSGYPYDLVGYGSFTRTANMTSLGEAAAATISISSVLVEDSGTKMYIFSGSGSSALIRQYTLSTAYDISSATYANKSFDVYADYGSGGYLGNSSLSSDGKQLLLANGADDIVMHYVLGTAWDISTASRVATYNPAEDANVSGVHLKPDNSKFFMLGGSNQTFYRYSLGSSSVLALGSGSFASTDVGKRIVGNGGDVVLTATSGTFDTTGGSAFTDSSTIAAGSWSMFGLKSAGDADGITLAGVTQTGSLNIDEVTFDSKNIDVTSVDSDPRGIRLSNDGTKFFMAGANNDEIFQYNLSTAFDLNSGSYNNISHPLGGSITGVLDVVFNNDGTKMFVGSHTPSPSRVYEFNLSTAFDLSTISTTSNTLSISGQTGSGAVHGVCFNNDGTKFYVAGSSSYVYQYALTTAFDLSSGSYLQSYNAVSAVNDISGVNFNSNGTSMYISCNGTDKIHQFNLTTAYDVTTASYANKSLNVSSVDTDPEGFCFANNFTKMYLAGTQSNRIYEFTTAFTETFVQPTAQYNVAVTNTSGRIDSSSFLDINGMTAAQSAGSGTVNYAVSTDGRTTWSVAKGTDGVRPIVRNNSGTWQYNSQNTSTQTGYDFSTFAYANSSLDLSSSGLNGGLNDITISSDGTKIYFIDNNGMVRQHTLSTAYDLSTSGSIVSFNSRGEDIDPRDVVFKPDGTKMYVLGDHYNRVSQYALSTAWDVSTASYENKNFAVSNQMSAPMSVQFKSDGYTMYVKENTNIMQYTLSTAWDVSTASYANKSFNNQSQDSSQLGMFLKPDGTKMYTVGTQNDKIYEYNFGTAFDVATLSYSNNSYSLDSANGGARGITISSDGTKIYIADYSATAIYQYNFGLFVPNFVLTPTWTNGTVNDELYTLQQALSIGANRMGKTQLDAVADANHFPTGSSLDLMIALRMDAAASTLPTSDGVTLNYDAAALNESAVLGTDYDFFFPSSTKVQIKSLAAQNLKVRVV